MSSYKMTNEILTMLAARFKALSEPARLQILNTLRQGELSVSEIIKQTGIGQANASKHLQLLDHAGFVVKRKQGLNVFYKIADDGIETLCELMCGRLHDEIERQHASFSE